MRCVNDAFLWDELEQAIKTAVRFLDNVIDVTPYFHDDIEQRQNSERRIGLGTMGLAEVLIRLGLRYGSDDSLEFIDKLYRFIAETAYLASVELAKEKGAFPAYNEQFMNSGFMKQMQQQVRAEIETHGIRNLTSGSMVSSATESSGPRGTCWVRARTAGKSSSTADASTVCAETKLPAPRHKKSHARYATVPPRAETGPFRFVTRTPPPSHRRRVAFDSGSVRASRSSCNRNWLLRK